jgi:hypothetical protein
MKFSPGLGDSMRLIYIKLRPVFEDLRFQNVNYVLYNIFTPGIYFGVVVVYTSKHFAAVKFLCFGRSYMCF